MKRAILMVMMILAMAGAAMAGEYGLVKTDVIDASNSNDGFNPASLKYVAIVTGGNISDDYVYIKHYVVPNDARTPHELPLEVCKAKMDHMVNTYVTFGRHFGRRLSDEEYTEWTDFMNDCPRELGYMEMKYKVAFDEDDMHILTSKMVCRHNNITRDGLIKIGQMKQFLVNAIDPRNAQKAGRWHQIATSHVDAVVTDAYEFQVRDGKIISGKNNSMYTIENRFWFHLLWTQGILDALNSN